MRVFIIQTHQVVGTKMDNKNRELLDLVIKNLRDERIDKALELLRFLEVNEDQMSELRDQVGLVIKFTLLANENFSAFMKAERDEDAKKFLRISNLYAETSRNEIFRIHGLAKVLGVI